MRKGKLLLVMGAAMVASLCGCQKSPEESIVANKDFDNMIEQADNTEEGSVTDVSDVAVNYDTYNTTFTDESLGVTVNADAKVDIPETSQMSIFRVKTAEISQDFLDKVRETLSPGVTYYEGRATRIQTRADIESTIQNFKSMISEVETSEDYENEEDRSYIIGEYQGSIDELEEEYKNAPETVDLEQYPSDNQLHSVNDLYNSDKGDDYYEWQYSLNPNGEIFYGVSDAKDGNYISLYVQNNENLGNCLSYRSSKRGYVFNSSVMPGTGYNNGICKADEPDISWELLGDVVYDSGETPQLKEVTNEPVTITEDQAKQEAEELINSLGLTDYKYYESGLYCEIPDIRGDKDANHLYRKVYMITYMRNIEGVYVNNDGGNKHTEGWDGDSYVKKDWGSEKIVILVNDSGIVGFDYTSPIEVLETVVDKSNLKTFDEIKSIFEEMSVVVYARENSTTNIDIDRVVLRYTRISEADNFDGGILVPVWDFMGMTSEYDDSYPGAQETINVLTINAIDGTIIDRDLGY